VTAVAAPDPRHAVVAAIERHQREVALWCVRAQGGLVEDREDLAIALAGLPVPFTSQVHAARLDAAAAERDAGRVAGLLVERGVPGTWWVGPLSRPPELPPILERHGFAFSEDLPWLAADLDRVPREEGSAPPGLAIRPVEDAASLARYLDVMQAGFGMGDEPRRAMQLLSDAVGFGDGRDGWIRFLGTVDGRPVATAGLMFGGGIAGVYNVATVPDVRRRGYATALTAAATGRARALGFRVAALGSSPLGRGLYERLGFREACVIREHIWRPPSLSR
jgi:ribosomal protein S18 acetylase RimI-like enzyme